MERGMQFESEPISRSVDSAGLHAANTLERNAALKDLTNAPFDELPIEELHRLDQEVDQVPEIQDYKRRKVQIDTMYGFADTAASIGVEKNNEKAVAAAEQIRRLTDDVMESVERYLGKIQYIAMQSEMQKFRMEQDEYIQYVTKLDRERSVAHSALMSNVQILSRYLFQGFPKNLSPQDASRWTSTVEKSWFTIDQIKNRDYIEGWAVETYSYSLAKKIHEAVHQTLEEKEQASN
jgi:hypothetical protein